MKLKLNFCLFWFIIVFLLGSCSKNNNDYAKTRVEGYVFNLKTKKPVEHAWVSMGYAPHGNNYWMYNPSTSKLKSASVALDSIYQNDVSLVYHTRSYQSLLQVFY